jgi:hypothetical protein
VAYIVHDLLVTQWKQVLAKHSVHSQAVHMQMTSYCC